MLTKASNIDLSAAFTFAINTKIKDRIIELNTIDQLFNTGKDANGDSLGEYTPFTVEAKKSKGARFDHITLKDTGHFYNSFTVRFDGDDIIIDADDSSMYDSPLTVEFGQDIIGLDDKSLDIIIELIRPELIQYVRNVLEIWNITKV